MNVPSSTTLSIFLSSSFFFFLLFFFFHKESSADGVAVIRSQAHRVVSYFGIILRAKCRHLNYSISPGKNFLGIERVKSNSINFSNHNKNMFFYDGQKFSFLATSCFQGDGKSLPYVNKDIIMEFSRTHLFTIFFFFFNVYLLYKCVNSRFTRRSYYCSTVKYYGNGRFLPPFQKRKLHSSSVYTYFNVCSPKLFRRMLRF